jgi:uncharacterized membrane protein YphA (DoxX/SURF4 family)
MNLLTWILQIFLAVAFIGAGAMKILRNRQQLMERMEWVRTVSDSTVKIVGLVEVLGGLGLVLPALTGVAVWLTVAAAIGLSIVMVLAVITHVRLHEGSQALPAIVLLVLLIITIIGLFHVGRV